MRVCVCVLVPISDCSPRTLTHLCACVIRIWRICACVLSWRCNLASVSGMWCCGLLSPFHCTQKRVCYRPHAHTPTATHRVYRPARFDVRFGVSRYLPVVQRHIPVTQYKKKKNTHFYFIMFTCSVMFMDSSCSSVQSNRECASECSCGIPIR